MPDGGLLGFVNEYGYLAIFLLVFLQELGVPLPNELVLIFAGALTEIGDLNFWIVFLVTVLADVIGTTCLFSVFYFFEHFIMERIKKWEFVNKKLEIIKARLIKHDKLGIFIGRMTPYLRGYVSVAAGILNLPYRVFVPIAVFSAMIWTGGYVTLGHFLGKQWPAVAEFVRGYQWILLVALILGVGVWFFIRHRKKSRNPL
ncbi:MAG: DedA family protein [Candidatus Harrisonbacteria bacterium]|nr:DedA family protein [Candidatus Harrisonbacteria bacterium]